MKEMKEKTIIQHVPSFCDGFDRQTSTYNTTDELLNILWVKSWEKTPFKGVPFYRYSVSKDCDKTLLMIEYKHGDIHKWLVIGYLYNDDGINLPSFIVTKEQK